MKVLMTGASSFTGYWFANELALNGHSVTATFQRSSDHYEGLKHERNQRLDSRVTRVWNCSFGDDRFQRLAASESWDVVAHHGADVTDYKSPSFNVDQAVTANTMNISDVLAALQSVGCNTLLLTGSVFEAGEGAGSQRLPAFSPYGVSKDLTWRAFECHALDREFSVGKFVIPNPFGPMEEPRFTAYLMRCWKNGEVASVNTPDYVRDNIHVELLARAYRVFAESLLGRAGSHRTNPSGYVESQGQFARRFAAEMRKRLGYDCELEFKPQTDTSEPMIRINTDPVPATDFSSSDAWDRIAEYYR